MTGGTPDLAKGLSEAEVRAARAVHGANRAAPPGAAARLRDAAHLLADPMALMLAVCAGVYYALGETGDAVVLTVALVPVLGVDVLLEVRSRKALAELARRSAPRARVRREGAERLVDGEDLVPGDVLLVAEGDVVHADARLVETRNLVVDEAALTGESEPVRKAAPDAPRGGAGDGPSGATPPDAAGLLLAGSTVLSGQAVAVVVATGARSRFGAVTRLVAESEPDPSPLQRATTRMVRRLAIAAAGLAAAVFGLQRMRGVEAGEAFVGAVALAVAAMPEEFPLVSTLFLALGAARLGRAGVLVRRLSAVETLGSTSALCVDKTGTLTEGRFVVEAHEPIGAGVTEHALLEVAVLACEPAPSDPMDRAIVAHAADHGIDAVALVGDLALVRDHDFDPVGKHVTHVWRRRDGRGGIRVAAKGALEGVLEHCSTGDAGLDESIRAAAEAANRRLAEAGLRVLAVAAAEHGPEAPGEGEGAAEGAGTTLVGEAGALRPVDRAAADAADAALRARDEAGLRLVGLLGFHDPLRPDAPAAVRECLGAGMRVVMITGDHAVTAHAIAHAAGIPHADDGVVTSADLDAAVRASDSRAVDALVARASVFARMRPEQKHTIVEALLRAGHTVAMTGDGINDAPALRRADIGVAIGERASAVARAAAGLVLLRDDFATLVHAVREGRHVFDNLRKSFHYLLAFHVPLVALALLVPLLGLPILLMPVHLLWLELIVHPVSALLFEAEPAEPDLMRRPPRPRAESVLRRGPTLRSLATGGTLTAATLAAFVAQLPQGAPTARAAALATLIFGALLLIFAERAPAGGLLRAPAPRGARFWGIVAGVLLSVPAAVLAPPLAGHLRLAPPTPSGWALAATLAVAAVAWRALPFGARTTRAEGGGPPPAR
jgi:Ca2+-transporting ATPase